MQLSEFNFDLPENLIAQEPVSPRDHSRLLILDRKTGAVQHRKFYEIDEFLKPNDVLVFNAAKVFPARLFSERSTGRKMEILLISPADKNCPVSKWPAEWKAIGSPKPKTGQKIDFRDDLSGEIITESFKNGPEFVIRFSCKGDGLKEKIHKLGNVPLPPYIKNPTERSFRGYQTVYATEEGSVAAPTAGFHFTEDLIESLRQKGVEIEFVSLNVGLGTFQPVKTENIEDHKMHSESFEISEDVAKRLNVAKRSGKRIIAVGTTACRALESVADKNGNVRAEKGETGIFIYPGYEFKFVDGLITNFHLPKSTLLMLVAAFAGKEKIFKAYEEAIRSGYRFYSFGDAMLIK